MMDVALSRRLAGLQTTRAWGDADDATQAALLQRLRNLQTLDALPARLRRLVDAALAELGR